MMIEAEVQAGMYIITCSQQCKLKLANFGHARQSQDLEHEPILLTGLYRNTHTISQLRRSSLTGVNGRTGLNEILKGGCPCTQKCPRSLKGLMMEFIGGAREVGIDSAAGSTPQYSRLKYTPFRLVE